MVKHLIECGEITVRKFDETDVGDLSELLADGDVMKYLEGPLSEERARQFFKDAAMPKNPLVYAAEKQGKFMGYVIYHDFDCESIEIGWVLKKSEWNKGYATAITNALKEHAAANGKRAVIECSPEQEVTKKIALKCGFKFWKTENGCDVYLF